MWLNDSYVFYFKNVSDNKSFLINPNLGADEVNTHKS